MSLLTAIALVSFVAAPVPKEAPKPESMEGEWKVVQILHGGRPHNPDGPAAIITIKGDTMTIKDGTRDEVATFTLDPKVTPATIDIREVKGGKPGKLVPGIYLLEKDKLTVCFGMEGADRPKAFASPEGSKTGLFVAERVKK